MTRPADYVDLHRPMSAGEIVLLRQRLELSQAGLALLMSVNTMTISRWERGLVAPSGCSRVVLNLLQQNVRPWKKTGGLKERRLRELLESFHPGKALASLVLRS